MFESSGMAHECHKYPVVHMYVCVGHHIAMPIDHAHCSCTLLAYSTWYKCDYVCRKHAFDVILIIVQIGADATYAQGTWSRVL